MNGNELIDLVILMVLLFVGWWLYFIEFKPYMEDVTRQKLFKIRDDLFDKAKVGDIAFDEPAYGMTRTNINGMIRFSHELGFIRFILLVLTLKGSKRNSPTARYAEVWGEAFSKLETTKAKKAVLEAHAKMHVLTLKHLVFSSIIVTMIVLPLLLFLAVLLGGVKSIKRKATRSHKAREKWTNVDAALNRLGAAS